MRPNIERKNSSFSVCIKIMIIGGHDYLRKCSYCMNHCYSCWLWRSSTINCVILYVRSPITFYVLFSKVEFCHFSGFSIVTFEPSSTNVVSQKSGMICYLCVQRAPKLHQRLFPWKVSSGSKMSPVQKNSLYFSKSKCCRWLFCVWSYLCVCRKSRYWTYTLYQRVLWENEHCVIQYWFIFECFKLKLFKVPFTSFL
jgi:hypothetical protein